MIVPLLMLDLLVSAYQAICFPLYEMPRVRRSSFIVIDRQDFSPHRIG